MALDRAAPDLATALLLTNGETTVEGTIVRIDPAVATPGRRDPWKVATILIWGLAMIPVVLAIWLATVVLRVGLSVLGVRGIGGGRGLFAEILLFHALGAAVKPGDPVPVYFYVLSTPTGQVMVKQEGELETGRIFPGNRVRISGPQDDGVVVLRQGTNLTHGVVLAARRSRWRYAFWFTAALALMALVASLAGGAA